MSSEIAISVHDLSKCFHIYDKPRDRLFQMLARDRKQYFREFWALKGVSFDIRKGETVGIVGRNGSGKSTLLQLVCGTLNPTHGTITTNGRIAALLELGSGFNPEFSGRENVYMNAAVLGLSREETDARFSEIEAFAEIGEFIDQAVKTYSSGMMVRLAFAVAINVEPQILIVDEALSVGDELFQRKCFARIEAIKESGATILFVSHSGSAVVELCDRAILLDSGEKLIEGAPKSIIGKYQKLLYAPREKVASIRQEIISGAEVKDTSGSETAASGVSRATVSSESEDMDAFFDPHLISQSVLSYESHGAWIERPQIVDLTGEPVNCLKRGDTYRYTYQVRFETGATAVRFGMMIKTPGGVELGGSVSAANLQGAVSLVNKGSVAQVEFSFQCRLNPGTYFLNAGVTGTVGESETYLHRLLDACLFRVLPIGDNVATGTVDFNCVSDHTLKNIEED
ncbi:ABC transporter ATP-binding protein [Stutzerimonas kunmingensis]|jgi:lipopolysaccharide transport system ATP-binding protein|uniref:ABC transporter ATP-binding protein n=1 Tax=Stutzerimonas kunmingensis TaxID=1211807 RepID=UPI00241D11AA|nr:ABC transporter ATP-binding protein [Stutzerimonas kunmingensis]|tara:strand:+ start:5777 stop:7144 length:1368 start_codon:yes stop_codon:yes gene_type:complete